MPRFDKVTKEIRHGMARAFFATAWATQHDEGFEVAAGRGLAEEFLRANGSLSGQDIMDLIPEETDPAARKAADELHYRITRDNGTGLPELYKAHPAGLKPEDWGHYAAMQAMGHGVGLWEYDDAFGREGGVKIPDLEFTDLHLLRNYMRAPKPPRTSVDALVERTSGRED